jgi:hypothetical protein
MVKPGKRETKKKVQHFRFFFHDETKESICLRGRLEFFVYAIGKVIPFKA